MKLIVANTKMYLNTMEEVEKFQREMDIYKNYFIVAPQNIYLENFVRNGFSVAAQNVSNKESGAHTGETSPKSLKDLKVEYVMIGHAEIRKKYKIENFYIQEKIKKSLNNNLKVILCIGEKLKKKNEVYTIIEKQLENIKPNENLIISYEPVWAIGGSNILGTKELIKIINFIKEKGHKKVLYGGSITEENINRLNEIENIDGFLVGSRSVDTKKFKKIIEVVK